MEYIISLDVGQYRQFVPCYQNSPYPPLGMWQEWSQEPDTLLDKYATFSSAPFGARKLRYAFDLKHYHQQKSLFNGLICNGQSFSTDMFTDELGARLASELSENREKSIPELQSIFANGDNVRMLCAATELLARTTPQKDLDSPGQISQEMNTTQMMAAYAT